MSIIVEVGAYRGTETFQFLQDPESQVFAFEPDQSLFRTLWMASHTAPRLHVLPFAVDIGDGKKVRVKSIAKMWGLGTPEDLKTYLEHHEQ